MMAFMREDFLMVWIILYVMEDVVMQSTGAKGINFLRYLTQMRQQAVHTMLIILAPIAIPKRGVSQQICLLVLFSIMKSYTGPIRAKIVSLLATLILPVHNGSLHLNSRCMAVKQNLMITSIELTR